MGLGMIILLDFRDFVFRPSLKERLSIERPELMRV
jgi:hypothetical protein